MAQVKEPFAALNKAMDKKQKCEYDAATPTWSCNLDGSSTTLGKNTPGEPTDASQESQLSASRWPSQAHHLIPHKQLKGHQLSKWLKADGNLFADTKYNVDHKNNGKWMPYASKLKEWKGATPTKKRNLMFKVMRLANIQLHQGRHSRSDKYRIGVTAYKARVDEYLNRIRDNAVSHVKGQSSSKKKKKPCTDCQNKKQGKKFPPRNNTL